MSQSSNDVLELWLEMIDLLELDIKKTFDVILHPILLKKLYALGIRGTLFNWIKSYLTNRSQFVLYNNVKSETKFVTHDVPQGSILG